ncbi:HupE/UreJ family protein [uncultured Paraglaciecola sp.]|uniref:HupE/UreJ family protein n=1 Tax=uncultured Paraglaciecola sp. TaxID=1765024 RepID=UPI0025942C7B|nr:HupE/UreJ family protein [uncultured Paraglaciecola sp.]
MLIKPKSRLLQQLGFISLLLCLQIGIAKADVFNSADFRITQEEHGEDNQYTFIAQLPSEVVSSTEIILPYGCELEQFKRQSLAYKSQLSYQFVCASGLSADAEIVTPWYIDGAKLYSSLTASNEPITLKRSLNTVVIPLSNKEQAPLTRLQTVQRYLWQGMLHIWFGWDHLAFVLCLCLLATGPRLFSLITTFTIGHSITLALAHYQLLSVPIAPVEVLIAFSIMLMAKEALVRSSQTNTRLGTSSILIVTLFGLIHGLGFASALSELGMPANQAGLALLFFNLGVEVGQVIFIAVLLVLAKQFTTFNFSQIVRTASLYLVGILGAFWAVERLVGFNFGQLA